MLVSGWPPEANIVRHGEATDVEACQPRTSGQLQRVVFDSRSHHAAVYVKIDESAPLTIPMSSWVESSQENLCKRMSAISLFIRSTLDWMLSHFRS